VTGFAIQGANVTVFSSGRGSPVGCAVMPVVKLTGNPATFRKLESITDFNAGVVVDGAPTHVLVVPKCHVERISDFTESSADAEIIGRLHLAANRIADERGLTADGYRLVINCNEGAGQSVWHVHLHLLGGRAFSWPPG